MNKKIKKIWVWDVETLDIFTATFLDKDSILTVYPENNII